MFLAVVLKELVKQSSSYLYLHVRLSGGYSGPFESLRIQRQCAFCFNGVRISFFFLDFKKSYWIPEKSFTFVNCFSSVSLNPEALKAIIFQFDT